MQEKNFEVNVFSHREIDQCPVFIVEWSVAARLCILRGGKKK